MKIKECLVYQLKNTDNGQTLQTLSNIIKINENLNGIFSWLKKEENEVSLTRESTKVERSILDNIYKFGGIIETYFEIKRLHVPDQTLEDMKDLLTKIRYLSEMYLPLRRASLNDSYACDHKVIEALDMIKHEKFTKNECRLEKITAEIHVRYSLI